MAYSAADFKAARQRTGLTQKDLAERLGVSERAVTRWESDGVPDGAHSLGRIERILGLNPSPDTAEHTFEDRLKSLLELAGATPRLITWALRRADELELLSEIARRLAARRPTTEGDPLADTPDHVMWPADALPSPNRTPEQLHPADHPLRGSDQQA